MTSLACPACNAALPSAFPGARVACACGHVFDVPGRPGSPAPGPDSGGPYRASAPSNEPAPSTTCPFCGNQCPAMVRICPHCDVRLENVRCQRCFSLQPPGTFACARCGQALQLEPLLDASDAPCPRCQRPLEVSPGAEARTHECPHCGGMFVPPEVLAEILCDAEIGWTVDAAPSAASPTLLEPVRYVPCPLCHSSMNRVNFGRVSGVIVDVCKLHGTWFDAGELTRVVAFASGSGRRRPMRG